MIFVGCLISLVSCTPSAVQPINKEGAKTELRDTFWWKKLHDPTLNQLIEHALEHNNQLLAAHATVVQAQAQLKAAYDVWLPTLNISANGFSAQGWNSHITPQGGLAASSALSQVNSIKINGGYAGFVPTYSVNFLENINNTQLANASLEMQKARYYAVRLSIISQTAGAYFSLLGQKEHYQQQQNYINHLKQLRSLESIRYHDGASSLSTLTQLDQTLADNEAQLTSIQYGMVLTQNTLQLLTDNDPGPVITKRRLNQLTTQHLIPSPLPANVLQNRPDLIEAKEQMNKAHALIGLSYSAFFPQISLTGVLGGSSIELIHLLKLSTGLGLAQAAVKMSVFNAAAYQQINAAKAGAKEAYYHYMQVVRSALVDVDNSLMQYKSTHAAYIQQTQAYHASLRHYDIVFARYQTGLNDKRASLDAQLRVDLAAINCTVAKIEELNSIVAVYQALGGGYHINNDII